MKQKHTSLKTFQKAAKSLGATTKKVSTSKSHGDYWQARQKGMVIGFFLTGSKTGHIEDGK